MTNKKRALSRLTSGGLALCMAFSAYPAVRAEDVSEHSVPKLTRVNEISYTETLENTPNPYRGFYQHLSLEYKNDMHNRENQQDELEDLDRYASYIKDPSALKKRQDNAYSDYLKAVEQYGSKANDSSLSEKERQKAQKKIDDKKIEWIRSGYMQYELIHLRISIADFSKQDSYRANHSSDSLMDGDDDAAAALEELLQRMRANGQTAIVRFAYDYDYNGNTKDNGDEPRSVFEPENDSTIYQHQQALGEVISRYPDVVYSVDCGLIGPWGEMHSSDRKNASDVQAIVSKWLEVLTDDSITLNVRTPEHFCWYMGYDDKQTKAVRKNMGSEQYITKAGTQEYRIGIFNDGYMGSPSDYGTYYSDDNRENELLWLENQSKHTSYGGEILAWTTDEKYASHKRLNTVEYLEEEAYRTHLSYLNNGHSHAVTDKFMLTEYSGSEAPYSGSGATEFEYLRNRMGYRFVVKDVQLTKELSAKQNFSVNTRIENVGFGDLLKDEKTTLIITNGSVTKEYRLDKLNAKLGESASGIDPTKWESGTDISHKGSYTLKAAVDLPDDMPTGNYKVYLKIANDKQGQGEYPIRFANAGGNVYDKALKANFLGSFDVTAPPKNDSSSSKAESSSSKAGSESSSAAVSGTSSVTENSSSKADDTSLSNGDTSSQRDESFGSSAAENEHSESYADTDKCSAEGHYFSGWKTVEKADCISNGLAERQCYLCGIKETTVIPAKGHDFELFAVKEATHEADGEKTLKCKDCGLMRTEVIPKLTDEDTDTDADAGIKGDVNSSGTITVTDISLAAAHVKGVKALEEQALQRADANSDGRLNVSDISLIAAHVKGIKALS